jgi:hypothetical protein
MSFSYECDVYLIDEVDVDLNYPSEKNENLSIIEEIDLSLEIKS